MDKESSQAEFDFDGEMIMFSFTIVGTFGYKNNKEVCFEREVSTDRSFMILTGMISSVKLASSTWFLTSVCWF